MVCLTTKVIHNLLWIVNSFYPNLYLQVTPPQDDTYRLHQPNSAQFPSSQPYLRCPQGGGNLPHHPMHVPVASGYPPHPSTLPPSRFLSQQPMHMPVVSGPRSDSQASRYNLPPSDPQASTYLPQQPVPLASGYPQSPYGREYFPQQPMPFPGYSPPRSSSYGECRPSIFLYNYMDCQIEVYTLICN